MSIRSTIQGSVGNVIVPAAGKSRTPSTSCSTEPWPAKPRAASAVLPLPRLPTLVMPGARASASTIDMSPRARIVSPSITLSVAGVSSGVRLRRLPVGEAVWRSAPRRPVTIIALLSSSSVASARTAPALSNNHAAAAACRRCDAICVEFPFLPPINPVGFCCRARRGRSLHCEQVTYRSRRFHETLQRRLQSSQLHNSQRQLLFLRLPK